MLEREPFERVKGIVFLSSVLQQRDVDIEFLLGHFFVRFVSFNRKMLSNFRRLGLREKELEDKWRKLCCWPFLRVHAKIGNIICIYCYFFHTKGPTPFKNLFSLFFIFILAFRTWVALIPLQYLSLFLELHQPLSIFSFTIVLLTTF